MPEYWESFLEKERKEEYFKKITQFINTEYSKGIVYPKKEEIFAALRATPFEKTKIVIIGQDPYHGENQAHGLAFSVQPGTKIPPSLINIFKELSTDLAIPVSKTGNLIPWAEQGVLLLNTVLTVRAGEANSHKNKGWEEFTDKVITKLNSSDNPIVFILWGKPAQEKAKLLNNQKHLILKAAHPSPLSAFRGFFGCKHFSKANTYLRNNNMQEINWDLSR
ncbi:MAG: uracil-DNA glycosylase [Eubacteriales bacterium]|nr:uracil-DNA glycosylase [Eubacteriales bacterium]